MGLGPDDVEGIGLGEEGIVRTLYRQQTDLGPVAVGDDELVVARDERELGDGVLDVVALD